MEKWKKIGLQLLFPHWLLVILLVFISTVALIHIFLNGLTMSIIGYISYVVSFYALVIVVARIPCIIKYFKSGLYANKYSNRYLTDAELRNKISMYRGFAINAVYSILKLSASIYYKSIWLGGIAIYYIVVSVMRLWLLYRAQFGRKLDDSKEQRRKDIKSYRLCGYMTFLLNIAVSGLVVQLIWRNETYSYPGFMIYAMAAYVFYRVIVAVIDMAKYRKMNAPVLSAAKMLSFACALMSLLALQTAMLTEFGTGEMMFNQIMNSLTGTVVCLLIFMMAIWMIKRANKELRLLEENHG
ncbi:MAG: hypothetical protein IKM20_00075 [Erysipelotrichales bacterium]|nr:hypothetical protein [Erysipelotrichales bacterium]